MLIKPHVSVIVPTHNRRDLLLRLLESLLWQDFAKDAFEIIVVCDGDTDGSGEAVADLALRHPRLRLIAQTQGGPAAARNAGAKAARGQLLAFTDDDCVASRHWLTELVCALECAGTVAVHGRTITMPSLCTPLTHQIESNPNEFVAPSCNVAYRRDAFEVAGGFDEGFSFLNEDVDLAWRVAALGAFRYAPNALIVHPPRPESFKRAVSWVRNLESEFLLFAKNPAAYRKYRGSSPWMTIYWKILVCCNYQQAKGVVKYTLYRGRPDQSLIQAALIVARSWLLVSLFPRFRRAARKCRLHETPQLRALGTAREKRNEQNT